MKKIYGLLVVLLVLGNNGFCLVETGTPTQPVSEQPVEPTGIKPQRVEIKGVDRSEKITEEKELIIKPLPLPEPPAYSLEKLTPPVIEKIPSPATTIKKREKDLSKEILEVKPTLYSLGLSYGNRETLGYDFSHTNETPALSYSLSINRSRTDGFSQGTISSFSRSSLDELNGQAVYTFNNWSLRTMIGYFNKELTLPYTGRDENKNEKSVSCYYEVKIPTDSKFSLGVDIVQDALKLSDTENTGLGAHLQFITPFKPNNPPISIGSKLYLENVSHQDYTPRRSSLYLEAAHLRVRNNLLADLKLSYDSYKNKMDYTQMCGLLRLHYNLKNGLLLRVIVERELSLPVFLDLYLKNDYAYLNPELEPEERFKLTLQGAYQLSSIISLEGNIFNQSSKRLIYWGEGANNLYQPRNLSKASMSGISLSLKHPLNPSLSQYVSYSYCYAKNKSDNQGKLPYLPANRLKIGLEYKNSSRLTGNLSCEYVSSRFTTTVGSSSDSLESYFLVNIEGERGITDTLSYFLVLENLLNEKYETWQGYFGQKRGLILGMMLKF